MPNLNYVEGAMINTKPNMDIMARTLTERDGKKKRKELWMKYHGDKLVDVFCDNVIVNTLEECWCA